MFWLYERIFYRRDAERVSEFIDLLNRDNGSTDFSQGLLGEPGSDLAELIRLARHIKVNLAPVDPSPMFESGLRLRLLTAASQPHDSSETAVAAWRQPRFLIGAATVGSLVSAAAAIAFVSRIRTHSNARAAA